MKIYRLKIGHNFTGVCYVWHTSKRAAETNQRSELKDPDVYSAEVESVDVPTNKTLLVKWLNENLKTANG